MIKLSSVDFGDTVSFPLIADDVTDVAPRAVTEPVTVCVRLGLSAADVTAAGLVVCVWEVLATACDVPLPVNRTTEVLPVGPDDVVEATSTLCVWSPCVETAIVSA